MGPEFIFVAVLSLPMIIALILLKLTGTTNTPKGFVNATYWGTYSGAPKKASPYSGTIELKNTTAEELATNSPTTKHAVNFHP
ncbi:MAG TPA: hypothetical protein V6C72_15030 [Chroococcales cyanobacterium]